MEEIEPSDVDDWAPVSDGGADGGADDSEATLTRRNNQAREGGMVDLVSPLSSPFVPEIQEFSTDGAEGQDQGLEGAVEALKSPNAKSSLRRKSGSSLDAVALNLKSSPADPLLSDVNSISSTASVPGGKNSALSSVNDIIENSEKESHKLEGLKPPVEVAQSPSSAATFFDNMISSLSFKQGSQPSPQQVAESSRKSNPPDIITHRRQPSTSSKKFGKKANTPPETSSPLREVQKPEEMIRRVSLNDQDNFDRKRFVEETYLDTPFHYASAERNAEFHGLFKNVPDTERLLDDFSCALSREFLYQGRIYISETHLCFSSSLLGWIAKVVTPFKDVTYMEKTSTAGLFPNAISIETESSKTQFNGFISRDTAFTLLKEVWSRTLLAQGDKRDEDALKSSASTTSMDRHATGHVPGNRSYTDLVRPNEPPSRTSYVSENDSAIEDAIRSVDDYTPSHYAYDSGIGSEDEEDDEDDNEEEASDRKSTGSKTKKIGYKLKPKAHYEYDGPYYARPTTFQYKPEDNKETVLAEIELDAPPGVVFQLLFSETNPKFWLEFFKTQDSSQFSPIGRFDQVNQEGQHYREFTYAKGLHFPVGPKSTKCVVQETILHLDYSDYINVLNITRTPDVPSGGSFSTRTRYMFRWASETTCALKVSYWVEWTATSWIKSMVESSCRSGQVAATKDLVEHVKRYVAENTEKGVVSVYSSPSRSAGRKSRALTKPSAERISGEASTAQIASEGHTVSKSPEQASGGSAYVLPMLLIIILLLALNLLYQMSIKRDIDKIQNFMSSKAGGQEALDWLRGKHPLIDLPAKAPSAKGGIAGELERWLGRGKLTNTTHRENGAVEPFLRSLETLLEELGRSGS